MPAPVQIYNQPTTFSLVDLDSGAPESTTINDVTIHASYQPQASKWAVSVNTQGRTAEMTYSFNASVPTQEGALALCRALVDVAYDLAVALPAA